MSKVPIVRQISWLAIVPQMIVMIAVVAVASSLAGPNGADIAFFSAFGIFVGYLFLSRELIAHDHRRGIRLVKRREYEKAIPCFEKSYDFFTNHPTVDKLRSIVMLSASSVSYREMALVNTAFCHSQIGNGDVAKQYYHKTLDLFPDSGLAQAGMNMVLAFEKKGNSAPEVGQEVPDGTPSGER